MQGSSVNNETKHLSWLDNPIAAKITLNWENILFALILIFTIFTRFYSLGSRVMSHDETSHVYFSWLFEQGNGYSHDPVTHGPLQFHLISGSYFLFGDSDFTSRLPAALFSIATVFFMWKFRRILGRAGALIGAVLFSISPYMLYYGRYARNEAFVGLLGVVTIWAILRYLDTGSSKYLYTLTAATVLHFTCKETSFIYTAQALIFLSFYLISKLSQRSWKLSRFRNFFLIATIVGLIMLSGGGAYALGNTGVAELNSAETSAPAVPGEEAMSPSINGTSTLTIILVILGTVSFLIALIFLIRGYTWKKLCNERSFSLLILLGTLVLPQLAPFPVKLLGYNPIDYNNNQSIIITTVFLILLASLSIIIGFLWNRRLWLINASIFYAIFTVFYTSVFTNGFGFITGMVGSLGYWLEQQGVNRGSQPWYYYGLIQIPIYEYLPALGSLLAGFLLIIRQRLTPKPIIPNSPEIAEDSKPNQRNIIFLGYWLITSLIAYSVAGEKMPWLTFHITLPMILLAAFSIGNLIENIDWQLLWNKRGFLVLVLLPLFFISMFASLGSLLGPNPPFQGKELTQLRSTSTFLTAFITAVISGWGVSNLIKNWSFSRFFYLASLAIFALLSILTARTAIQAAFINYDYANELLVYAHMARGPKEALAQVEEISRRTTNGLGVKVAFDNETTYPYWWYLRNYTNQDYFGENPTRAQRDAPVILVGEPNFNKIEPILGQAYNKFEYIRIWWPNQDYFGLTKDRVINAIKDPNMRTALFQIWLNRDFSAYAEIKNKDMSLQNWTPSSRMRLYIRKDIVSQIWNYGTTTTTSEEIVADPYEDKQIKLSSDKIIGTQGSEPGQFQRPRDIAVADDGTIYIADTENHRIQHLSPDGNVLGVWGHFADITAGEAPGGTFYEPWGIALGPDGTVYVADTWNHRIQKFTPDGEYLDSWGYFGQGETLEAFWGPRDIAVDSNGRVYVIDTGNKRIVVFDQEGNPVSEFGEVGYNIGQFDEPVGITIDSDGKIYVADTWNQRIQVFKFTPDEIFETINDWEIVGWYGQSLDNKPYITVNDRDRLFVTDPEGYRILEFSTDGKFIKYWGDYGSGPSNFGLAGAVAIDPEGNIWVSDTNNNRIVHFILPTQ